MEYVLKMRFAYSIESKAFGTRRDIHRTEETYYDMCAYKVT